MNSRERSVDIHTVVSWVTTPYGPANEGPSETPILNKSWMSLHTPLPAFTVFRQLYRYHIITNVSKSGVGSITNQILWDCTASKHAHTLYSKQARTHTTFQVSFLEVFSRYSTYNWNKWSHNQRRFHKPSLWLCASAACRRTSQHPWRSHPVTMKNWQVSWSSSVLGNNPLMKK